MFNPTHVNKTGHLGAPKIEHHKLELELADLAYKSPTERIAAVAKLGGTIVPGFNDDEFMAVKINGKLYNVHRGSKTMEDWTQTDMALAVGELHRTDRYRRSLRKSLDARESTGMHSIEVGHSLGGTLAEKIALHTGDESTVFNQGTSPLENYHGRDRRRHRHFRMEGDGVSGFDPTATVLRNRSTSGRVAAMLLSRPNLPGIGSIATPSLVQTGLNHSLSSFATASA